MRKNSLYSPISVKKQVQGTPSEIENANCHLLQYSRWDWDEGWLRLGCEIVVVVLVIVQILMDVRDIRRIGRAKWFTVMKAFPAKLLYKVTFLLILCEVPIRFACRLHEAFLVADNVIAAIAVLLTTIHYLYYCRAIPFIGPFVLMIYTIISTDLTRFFLIYSIFLVGFSQYSCTSDNKEMVAEAGIPRGLA
ncbi:unnamed protein product [Heligmosomoides polygyrus]|uniref:Ion_trans domain-containing protein n=1 Tax=Heligmosomoides polygyrus TaxID=6339 RepID=A0A183FTF3_HELPZ|nr:unnamed protein product [Heligmosomoides polygyrus]